MSRVKNINLFIDAGEKTKASPNPLDFVMFLGEAMLLGNISNEMLAGQFHTSVQMVKRWKQGTTCPSKEEIKSIVDYISKHLNNELLKVNKNAKC